MKDKSYVDLAYMTGVLPIAKYSSGSELNMFWEYNFMNDRTFEEQFGLTEDEVKELCSRYKNISCRELEWWYDGFSFGERRDIYNPWSIINYLDKKKVGAYWANTSANSLVGKLLREGHANIKRDFEDLLRGGTLRMEIDEQIVYNQLSVKKMPSGAFCLPAVI